MWTEQIVLGLIGLSSGVAVAGGLFAFIVELGVVADLADRTHTAESLLLYEDSIALGGDFRKCRVLFSDHDSLCRLYSSLFRCAVRHICRMLGNGIGRNPECISDFYQESQAGTLYQVVYHRDCTWKRLWSMYCIFSMTELSYWSQSDKIYKIYRKSTIN